MTAGRPTLQITALKSDSGYDSKAHTVFDRSDFALLNSDRADETVRIDFADSQGRTLMSWIFGKRGGDLYAPFSAPYGMPSVYGKLSVAQAAGCICALRDLPGRKHITLPPDFYAPGLLPLLKATLLTAGAGTDYADYNYHISVAAAADPDSIPSRSARQELKAALRAGTLRYVPLDPSSAADVARVYAIIEANHKGKGYPVKMSLQRLTDTFAMLGGELGVVKAADADAAAQIGYYSSAGIYQPVYWGDLSEYTRFHPMKALLHGMGCFLKTRGTAGIIDLGPSSEKGVPAPGLCAFKASMGCELTLKPTFTL